MEPYIAQVIMFGGNFAPRGWAFCNGQLLAISQNTALFSILGTTYGGDGRTTFALPDLRGRAPIHHGTGPGLSPRNLGQRSGQESNTLSLTQLPPHNHLAGTMKASGSVAVNSGAADHLTPVTGDSLAAAGIPSGSGVYAYNSATPDVQLASGLGTVSGQTANTGFSTPINNEQPYLVSSYIIALVGIYPSRN